MIKSIDPTFPKIDELIASAQVSTRFRRRPGTTNQTVVTADDVERHYQAGLALYQKGGEANIRASLEQFRWIAQNDPENMKSLIVMNKIESQLRIGSSVEAADTGPKLTDNQKRLVGEYYFRGINFYSNNNYEKAIDEWRKVLAIDPSNEKAKNNIRKCLALLKK